MKMDQNSKSLILGLMLTTLVSVVAVRVFSRKRTRTKAEMFAVRDRLSDEEVIAQLEQRVQLDEGNRGIKCLIQRQVLKDAAKALMAAKAVVIVTGFPCLLDHPECPQVGK